MTDHIVAFRTLTANNLWQRSTTKFDRLALRHLYFPQPADSHISTAIHLCANLSHTRTVWQWT